MKRKILVVISIVLVCVMSIAFAACSFTKSSKVLPEGREISSIELMVYNSNNESVKKELNDEDKQSLIDYFNDLGFMDRYVEQFDVSKKLSSEEFKYVLEIKVKKKGLKKAYTYYVKIGRSATYRAMNKELFTEVDDKYLKIETESKKFKGEASQEVVDFLNRQRLAMI